MATAPRLDLRQTQSLVMTPQLQQAIKLLALSNLEIEAYVAQELEKNPLLEMARDEGERDRTEAGEMGGEGNGDDGARTERSADEIMADNGSGAAELIDADYSGENFQNDCTPDLPSQSSSGPSVTDMGS